MLTERRKLPFLGSNLHSVRKTVATLIGDSGLSARIGAHHLGQARISMTQDRYVSRGRLHTQVADILDRVVAVVALGWSWTVMYALSRAW
jgi:integrase